MCRSIAMLCSVAVARDGWIVVSVYSTNALLVGKLMQKQY